MENGIITGKDLVKFRKYLEDEEKSRATVEKYCRDVKKFLDYLGDLKCNREKVILYKKKLLEEGYEISSINSTRIYMISTGAEHRRKLESMRLII